MAPRRQVLIGGGQEASQVTTTSSRAGKFESRFFHKARPAAAGCLARACRALAFPRLPRQTAQLWQDAPWHGGECADTCCGAAHAPCMFFHGVCFATAAARGHAGVCDVDALTMLQSGITTCRHFGMQWPMQGLVGDRGKQS